MMFYNNLFQPPIQYIVTANYINNPLEKRLKPQCYVFYIKNLPKQRILSLEIKNHVATMYLCNLLNVYEKHYLCDNIIFSSTVRTYVNVLQRMLMIYTGVYFRINQLVHLTSWIEQATLCLSLWTLLRHTSYIWTTFMYV